MWQNIADMFARAAAPQQQQAVPAAAAAEGGDEEEPSMADVDESILPSAYEDSNRKYWFNDV